MSRPDPEATWIFGYGSLMWRPDFPHIERREGFIRGWKRRFHQGSPDHRGTPDFPGRVVTLLEDPANITWGIAYRLSTEDEAPVLEALDQREQAGYERIQLAVFEREGADPIAQATTWIATPDNADHLGSAPLNEMVAHIRRAKGPSGSNEDYVLALDQCLAGMQIVEDHVRTLADALRHNRGDERRT